MWGCRSFVREWGCMDDSTVVKFVPRTRGNSSIRKWGEVDGRSWPPECVAWRARAALLSGGQVANPRRLMPAVFLSSNTEGVWGQENHPLRCSERFLIMSACLRKQCESITQRRRQITGAVCCGHPWNCFLLCMDRTF